MNNRDRPKHDLIFSFGGFVSEESLGKEGREPAADQFEEMEGAFGRSPGIALRFLFVRPIGENSKT